MSIFPRKYHGDEVKCWGYGYCPDCIHRIDNKIPFPQKTLIQEPSLQDLRLAFEKAKNKNPNESK